MSETIEPRRRPPRPTKKRRLGRAEMLRRLVQGDLASLRVVIGLALIWSDLPVRERPLPLG